MFGNQLFCFVSVAAVVVFAWSVDQLELVAALLCCLNWVGHQCSEVTKDRLGMSLGGR